MGKFDMRHVDKNFWWAFTSWNERKFGLCICFVCCHARNRKVVGERRDDFNRAKVDDYGFSMDRVETDCLG